MRELAQHITDLVENSAGAGARRIEISIEERHCDDCLVLVVSDDGCGMPSEVLSKATDPFFTSRKCREVGLGLPLLAASAQRSGGAVRIQSAVGQGTTVEATFKLSNIDTPPMGDLKSTVLCAIVAHQDITVVFRRRVRGRTFEVDSGMIKGELGTVQMTHPSILAWLDKVISEAVAGPDEASAREEETYA